MTCIKDGYPSIVAARKVARRQMDRAKRTTGKRVNHIDTYRCSMCNQIHLTSHSKTNLKKAA